MYNNDSSEKNKSHPNEIDYWKKRPFHNTHIGKPKNIDLLSELLCHEELYVIKIYHAFRGYAMSYKSWIRTESINSVRSR